MHTIISLPLTDIHPYAGNPRCNDAAVDAVAESIRRYGYRDMISVDGQHTVICGHTRLKALQRLGWTSVEVTVYDDLTPDEVRALRIADNKTGELSEWDMEKLLVELKDLQTNGADLTGLAFDENELSRILNREIKKDGSMDEDTAPELPVTPVSKPGGYYQLGTHRLLCGDLLQTENLPRLMSGTAAALVFTDPPYNMNYQSKSLGGIKNDRMSEAGFVSFILSSVMAMRGAMTPNASYYICMSSAQYPLVYHQLRKAGMGGRQLIWEKPSAGLGGQEYRPQYEVMLYGYLGPRAERIWNGERRQSDLWHFDPRLPLVAREEDGATVLEFGAGLETVQVFVPGRLTGQVVNFDGSTSDLWRFSRPAGDYVHPTQKPVELVRRAVTNSSRPGDTVLDPFGGSGSTLIAAEQTGRTARLMELDPKYCDVIRRRWAEFVHGPDCDWQTLTPEVQNE